MSQCKGITKRGERCKILVKEGNYCHWHKLETPVGPTKKASVASTASKTPSPRSSSPTKTKLGAPQTPVKSAPVGFIYAYTLRSFENAHVFNSKKDRFEPLLGSGLRKLMFWNTKPKQLLIKIGYTTSTPDKRLDQWQNQCGHQLTLITPRARDAPGYDPMLHGWKCSDPHSVEHAIHNKLHALYGRGQVKCSCRKAQGIHVEWFLVPRKELANVCRVIDKIVSI